jgi:hypothetical protein
MKRDVVLLLAGMVTACGSGDDLSPPTNPSVTVTSAANSKRTAPTPDPDTVLFVADFDVSPLGVYTIQQLQEEWRFPPWANGVAEGRVTVVDGLEAFSGRSLRVFYPSGSLGPHEGGAQWMLELGSSYEELYCSYRVKFGEGFDFVLGGKLPGLVGGKANTGGNRPNGRDGWSARLAWRAAGRVAQYVYHPDQPGVYGEDFEWDVGGARMFIAGEWVTVEQRILMNEPGHRGGVIEGWWSGELALRRQGLRFRDVDGFAIDAFYFSTFFGGNSDDRASKKDEYVYFDNFVISTGRIDP